MNLLKRLSLCLLTVMGGGIPCFAQSANAPVAETLISKPDPIVEMLDSLVMLNNVIRYNSQNTYGEGITQGKDAPRYSAEIYEQRLAKIYSPIPLVYNSEVQQYIDLYAYRKRELTSRVLGLSNLYFPLFEEILDKEGLPLEFKYLSVVESALNPVAVSRVGATGLWQFMYNTGKMYNLNVNSFYDERRDPVKATHAACRYFKDMYAIYGDWLLVIAAYNCGAGNVNKAIRRSGGKTNFWEISRYLPAETRGYVPAFIAVTYVMNYSSEHSIFPVLPAYNYFEVDTVAVDRGITLRKISEAIDLPLDVLSYLNPVYKKGVIPETAEDNYLRLPASKVAAYINAVPALFDPVVTPLLASVDDEDSPVGTGMLTAQANNGTYKVESRKIKQTHTVRSGESLSVISQKLNCTVANLKSWNRLKSARLAKGQRLCYYTTVKVKVPVEAKDFAEAKVTPAKTQESDTVVAAEKVATVQNTNAAVAKKEFIYHMVQKGDTLWNIAQRYKGVTVAQIMKINRIKSTTNLKPGTKIKVKARA
jgi:membrane-bound lytic murein transglycosylase D